MLMLWIFFQQSLAKHRYVHGDMGFVPAKSEEHYAQIKDEKCERDGFSSTEKILDDVDSND